MPYYVKLGFRGLILNVGTKIVSYFGAIKYRRMRLRAGVPAPLGRWRFTAEARREKAVGSRQ